MSTLIFDNETTGLPIFKESSSHPDQPHIVQIAAILEDDDGRVRAEMNCIIKPDGKWAMSPEALNAHGITVEMAEKFGIHEKGVYSLFWKLLSMADTIVAHNLSFDFFMLRIAARRNDMPEPKDLPIKKFCTLLESKNIICIPPTEQMVLKNVKGYKSPSLQEAHMHFTGEAILGAHDAMNDVRACRKVYHAIKKFNSQQAA